MSTEPVRRIILDTDPGIDDALALFLALASPEVRLEAVTTVNGNVPVASTTRNALALLTIAGRTDIPVARGCERPLLSDYVDASYVHGESGLGYAELPEPEAQPIAQHAVDLLCERIMREPGEITLVAVGPLTNLALALRREPRIAQSVREVVIMGGALRVPGNMTPCAEFNIYVDPHAAQMVFQAGWPLRLVSLDVTTRVTVRREQIAALAEHGSRAGRFTQQMMSYYFDVFVPRYGVPGFQMHDPLALSAVFRPDLITWEPVYVEVELEGKLTKGETVAYFRYGEGEPPPPNMQVSVDVNAEEFIKLFFERVSRLR